jgi:hypothetical protein
MIKDGQNYNSAYIHMLILSSGCLKGAPRHCLAVFNRIEITNQLDHQPESSGNYQQQQI